MPILAYSSKDTMRPSVQAAWFKSIRSYEGYTTWLYFDTHKPPLATTGVGNMIDTGTGLSAFGLALPWRFKNGSYATERQIAAEYTMLKGLNLVGSGYAYEKHATLFLDEPVVEWMVYLKTAEFWNVLAGRFIDIEAWPADAQLALLNQAWWMGPYFTQSWPTLTGALKAQDFLKASENCSTVNPSPRNPDNKRRFTTAAMVKALTLDPGALYDTFTVNAVLVGKDKADSWYVQRMLAILGHYTLKLDGDFGPRSQAALKAYATKAKVTAGTVECLRQLAKDSGLKVTVQ